MYLYEVFEPGCSEAFFDWGKDSARVYRINNQRRSRVRADLLDEVIDPLADYIEANGVPAVKEKAQKRAYAIHRKALAEYMNTY